MRLKTGKPENRKPALKAGRGSVMSPTRRNVLPRAFAAGRFVSIGSRYYYSATLSQTNFA